MKFILFICFIVGCIVLHGVEGSVKHSRFIRTIDARGDYDLGALTQGRYLLTFWSMTCPYCKMFFQEVDRAHELLFSERRLSAFSFEFARIEAGVVGGLGLDTKRGFRHWGFPGLPASYLIVDGDREPFYGRSAEDLLLLNDRMRGPDIKRHFASTWDVRNVLTHTMASFVLLSSEAPGCGAAHAAALADFRRAARRFHHRAQFLTIFTDDPAARRDLVQYDPDLAPPEVLADACLPLVLVFADSVPDAETGQLCCATYFEGPFVDPAAQHHQIGVFPTPRTPLLEWVDEHQRSALHWLISYDWHLIGAQRYSAIVVADPSEPQTFDFVQTLKQSIPRNALANLSHFWVHPMLKPAFTQQVGCAQLPCFLVYETREAQFWKFPADQPWTLANILHFLGQIENETLPSESALRGFGEHFGFYQRKLANWIAQNPLLAGSIVGSIILALIFVLIRTASSSPEEEVASPSPSSSSTTTTTTTTTLTSSSSSSSNDDSKKNQ